jgi:rhamnosyltransferase subunit B
VTTKFLLCACGTKGDLLPLLALGAELAARGQRCHMLGNDGLAERAAELGVPYTVVAPAHVDNLLDLEQNFARYVFPAYEPTLRGIEGALAQGEELVLVVRTCYSAAVLAAERHALPLSRVYLAPSQVRSCEAPPVPWRARASGALGKAFRRYELPKIYEAWEKNPFLLGTINAHRRDLGLCAIDSILDHEVLVDHNLGLFPSWYGAPASDWHPMDLVGFPVPAPRGALPTRLSELIERHGRPLVFTPGTGVSEATRFFAEARRCCELLGRPGIFLSPSLSQGAVAHADRIQHFDFVDLGLLLPHAALLVHHGGIGTTARAIAHGVPQIISPQAYDQPDNAARVAELGVGAVLQPEAFQGEALAALARSLFESAPVARALAELSARVAATPALALAADVLIRRFALTPNARASKAARPAA